MENFDIDEIINQINEQFKPILSEIDKNLTKLDSLIGEENTYKFKPIDRKDLET